MHSKINVCNETCSDCEIIIHLYRRYGIEDTLLLLDGVFAFALYDEEKDTMYVARDLFGVRPLFQCQIGDDGFGFASELKMLSHIGSSREIHQFAPGTIMTILNGNVEQRPYALLSPVTSPMSRTDALNRVRSSFTNAVKKRVANTDRDIVCLLSGGLDSSLVAAIVAKEIYPRQLHTYSIGMPGSPDLAHAKICGRAHSIDPPFNRAFSERIYCGRATGNS